MKDYMKKAMLLGIGLTNATRENIEEYVEELVKEGQLARKESKDLINFLLDHSKKIKNETESKLHKAFVHTLRKLDVSAPKTMLIGRSLAHATRENIEEYVEELVKEGQLAKKESKELVDLLLVQSNKIREEMEKKLEKTFTNVLKKLNIPSKNEITILKEKIAKLEKALAKAEKKS